MTTSSSPVPTWSLWKPQTTSSTNLSTTITQPLRLFLTGFESWLLIIWPLQVLNGWAISVFTTPVLITINGLLSITSLLFLDNHFNPTPFGLLNRSLDLLSLKIKPNTFSISVTGALTTFPSTTSSSEFCSPFLFLSNILFSSSFFLLPRFVLALHVLTTLPTSNQQHLWLPSNVQAVR